MRLEEKEKVIFVITVIVLVLAITFTHVIGYLSANKEYYYQGNQPARVGDLLGHFSFIIQAAEGKLLFKNLYNPAEQRALFFHPLWLLMGLVVKFFQLNTFLVYQFFKVVLAGLFCLALRKFLKDFFDLNQQPWLLPFCVFSGGFFSWLIEKDTFTNLYYSPLFALVLALFIIIYRAVLKYFTAQKNSQLATVFFFSLLLFLVHFYDLVSLLAVIFSWCVYEFIITPKASRFKPAFFCFLAAAVGGIYYFYIFSAEPVLSRWAVNNYTLLPGWRFFLNGYGLILPLAFLGAVYKRKEKTIIYLILWCLTSILLIFSPIQFNRRLILGLSIPLTILAYWGVKFILDRFKIRLVRIISAVIIVSFLVSNNIFLIALDLDVIIHYGRPQYLKRNYQETFIWLKDNLPEGSVIFANLVYWDTQISGSTGLVSYLAGGYYTSFDENYEKIRWFFKNNEQSRAKEDFLRQNKINYLLFSDVEKRLGVFDPSDKDYLKLVYKNQDAEIYKFKTPLGAARGRKD